MIRQMPEVEKYPPAGMMSRPPRRSIAAFAANAQPREVSGCLDCLERAPMNSCTEHTEYPPDLQPPSSLNLWEGIRFPMAISDEFPPQGMYFMTGSNRRKSSRKKFSRQRQFLAQNRRLQFVHVKTLHLRSQAACANGKCKTNTLTQRVICLQRDQVRHSFGRMG